MTIRRAPVSPAAVAVAAVMAIAGYLLGVATAPRTAPTPTGSAAAAASPTHTPGFPTAIASPVQSRAPSTAAPTVAPPWAWERTLFPLDGQLSVDAIWGLSDRVLGMAAREDSWYVTWLGYRDWSLSSAPAAITIYRGGTVADDRLWFLAYVPGLRQKEISLRLVGTNGDENTSWKAFGPSDLNPDSPIQFLGKIRDIWVLAYSGEGGNIEIGAPNYLRTSRDGVHWSDPRVQSLRGVDPFDIEFAYAQAARDFIVVRAAIDRPEKAEHLLLVSRDGVSWRTVTPPAQVDWWDDLACSDRACVLTPFAFEDTPLPYPVPIAWVSTDGVTWTPSETILGDESGGTGIRHVAATTDGFVGIEGDRSNVAWISGPDGLTWTRHEVLPADLKVPIIDLAVSSDTVVALEQQPDIDSQGAWVGSLAALRSAN